MKDINVKCYLSFVKLFSYKYSPAPPKYEIVNYMYNKSFGGL